MREFGQYKTVMGKIIVRKILIIDCNKCCYFGITRKISHDFIAAIFHKRCFSMKISRSDTERTELLQHIQNIFFLQPPKTG